ncbi:MAG: thiamine-phosphate kinase [Balneolales bacterium]
MKLKELGEFGLIDQIKKRFEEDYTESVTGIGDDCAVIPKNERELSLVTCDTLIEDIHFKMDKIEPENLGYKSLAVNISDIAAMGGKAEYAFLSLAMPGDMSCTWIDRYLGGLHDLAREEGLILLGGDTTRSPERMAITITVIGSVDNRNVKRRSGAKPDDVICVTGYLGDSGGGLQLLLENREVKDEQECQLVNAHNRPKAFHSEGRWLSTQPGVHAMIDISDGLASDASHIAKASALSLLIETERLPVSGSLKAVSKRHGWNIQQLAVSAGEDYVLLCTVDPSMIQRTQETYYEKFGSRLFDIGKVKKGRPGAGFLHKGRKISPGPGGFNHFG